MKRFIKLNILFASLVFSVIFITIELSNYIISEYSDFSLKSRPKYIILGHSHSECAYNDSLIDSFVNLAQSGESYFYTYFKAKKILEQNSDVEVVFIEFTNNQVNESMNRWVWEEEYMNHKYPKYSAFMNLSAKILLLKNNPTGYFNAISLAFRDNFKRIRHQNFDCTESVGGFLFNARNKTDSLIEAIQMTNVQIKDFRISEYNLDYLAKVIELCTTHKLKVVLIRSPQHKLYSGFQNEVLYQKVREERFSKIEYIDCSRFPLNNSEFADLEHLNYKGAKVYSLWFNNLLNDGLLDKADKQAYVDEKINKLKAQ